MLRLEERPAPPPAEDALAQRAALLEARYGDLPAQEVMELVLREGIAGRVALVSSFGAESAVLLHMAAAADPATPVIFLDTHKHFPETLSYRDELAARLGLTDVRSVAPDRGRLAVADPEGRLFASDPDLCCHIRKVEPLARALAGFAAWITGRKRFQAHTRRRLTVFESDGAHIKINPLASWTAGMIADYLRTHDLPRHPLTRQGYLSIGCLPCTDRIAGAQDARAGRWPGRDKTECGIHLVNGRSVRARLEAEPDPDGPLWKAGAFQRDVFTPAGDAGELPAGPVIVSKARWLAERANLAGRNAPVGLLLAAGERIDDLAADLSRFDLIALDFPKFSDGRAFSTARLLREKHGFTGELRAVGNVLSDQIAFMRRVGFDAFEVSHAPSRRALAAGRVPEVTLHYQPATRPEPPAGTRPWLRRAPD